ncbi:MAG: flagellum-specific peptidoglycan hydrolase FlgJ [Myxococcota bacterium]|jgi:flagellum-specific peptidoglycan hydrolase FlgJ
MKGRQHRSVLALALGSLSALLVAVGGNEVIVSNQVPAEIVPVEVETPPPLSDAQRTTMRRAHLVDTFVFGEADARRWAASQIITEDADWPDDYRGEFFLALAPGALLAAHDHQIPPSVTLAQAAQESGWGRSSLASRYNNLFGVKAYTGLPSVTLKSAEILDGVRVPTRAAFAVFEDWDHAIEKHGELLAHSRYDKARENWTDWESFIRLIAPMYASDPLYASRVSNLVRRYNLDRWDHLVVETVDMAYTAPDSRVLADADEDDVK